MEEEGKETMMKMKMTMKSEGRGPRRLRAVARV